MYFTILIIRSVISKNEQKFTQKLTRHRTTLTYHALLNVKRGQYKTFKIEANVQMRLLCKISKTFNMAMILDGPATLSFSLS